MGLDMYLTKETYVRKYDPATNSIVPTVTIAGEYAHKINPARISCVVEEVAYWRKANAIHEWFVVNCQGGEDECKKTYVSTDSLQELLDTCQEVIDNPEEAEELLPSSSGFFFGSTDYDEWYFKDLKYTVNMLKKILTEDDASFYYQSSW
jgi:hypothetical protein